MTLRRGFFPALVTMCRVTVSTADMTADRLTLTGADIITQADTTSFWATVGRRQLSWIWLLYCLHIMIALQFGDLKSVIIPWCIY